MKLCNLRNKEKLEVASPAPLRWCTRLTMTKRQKYALGISLGLAVFLSVLADYIDVPYSVFVGLVGTLFSIYGFGVLLSWVFETLPDLNPTWRFAQRSGSVSAVMSVLFVLTYFGGLVYPAILTGGYAAFFLLVMLSDLALMLVNWLDE